MVLLACGSSYPPAPFTSKSADLIDSNFDLDGFQEEMATMAIGSPEAVELGGKYAAEAFEKSGYSLDETIYKYLKESTPAHTQMHIFMTRLQLGTYIVLVREGEEYEDALIRSGAFSERTVEFMKNKK